MTKKKPAPKLAQEIDILKQRASFTENELEDLERFVYSPKRDKLKLSEILLVIAYIVLIVCIVVQTIKRVSDR